MLHSDFIALPGLAQLHTEGPPCPAVSPVGKRGPRIESNFPIMGCFPGGLTTEDEIEMKKGVCSKQCLELILHSSLQPCLSREPSKQLCPSPEQSQRPRLAAELSWLGLGPYSTSLAGSGTQFTFLPGSEANLKPHSAGEYNLQ